MAALSAVGYLAALNRAGNKERYKIKKLCITSGLDKTDVIHSFFCSNIKY